MEESCHAGVSGKAGHKTGKGFRECFRAMGLALEVGRDLPFHQPGMLGNTGGLLCGIFGGGGGLWYF